MLNYFKLVNFETVSISAQLTITQELHTHHLGGMNVTITNLIHTAIAAQLSALKLTVKVQ